MDHAVGALLVPAGPVVVPVRVLDELPEGRGVAVLEQITRLLPAENVVRGIAPWRALVVHLAHEEVQKERRLVEPPVFLGRVQDAREHLPRPLSLEKVLLIGRLLVTVPRRDHHAFDAQLHHRVEELPHTLGIGIIEQSRIGRDPEPAAEGRLDCPDSHVIDAVPADRQVMLLPEPVHVDAERQILGRSVIVQLTLQQDGVGAEIDVLLPLDQPLHDERHFRVDERLPARDAHDRRAALFRRRPALLRRQALVQDMIGILNLPAAGARKVAAKQGLQHEDERVPLDPLELPGEHVRCDGEHLRDRNCHPRGLRLRSGLTLSPWCGQRQCFRSDEHLSV